MMLHRHFEAERQEKAKAERAVKKPEVKTEENKPEEKPVRRGRSKKNA